MNDDEVLSWLAMMRLARIASTVLTFSAVLAAQQSTPAGSDVAVSAVKSMLAAANSAYDNLTKVTKQATEIC